MSSKYNGRELRKRIEDKLEISRGGYKEFIGELYADGMSGPEISEYITRETGETVSGRSIQRMLAKVGETREKKEAFNNAINRGRVVWQLEEDRKRREGAVHQINRGLRYLIIKRDGGRCVLCGAKDLLQVDHILAKMNGGNDSEANLRTLCIDCNIGKAIAEGEKRVSGTWKKKVD